MRCSASARKFEVATWVHEEMLVATSYALGYHVPLHATRHQPCTMSASVGSLCTYGDDDSTLPWLSPGIDAIRSHNAEVLPLLCSTPQVVTLWGGRRSAGNRAPGFCLGIFYDDHWLFPGDRRIKPGKAQCRGSRSGIGKWRGSVMVALTGPTVLTAIDTYR